jgi:hypothetical protein
MTVIVQPGSSAGIGLTSAVFPLALPALPSFASIKVKMHDVVGVSESPYTLSRQSFEWPGKKLFAAMSLPPGTLQDTGRAWVAFLALMRGRAGVCLLGDTSLPVPRGSAAGVPLVNGANQAGMTLATKGWTASAPLVLRSGDWIQVGTGLTQRLYLNCLDVNADASGDATLTIYPPLRESPADGASIITQYPKGCFALTSNDREFDVDDALSYGITLSLEEAI